MNIPIDNKSDTGSSEQQKPIVSSQNSNSQNPFGSGYDVNIGGIEPMTNSNNNPTPSRSITKEINIEDIQNANVADVAKVNFLSDPSSASSFIGSKTDPPKDAPSSNTQSQSMFGNSNPSGDAPFINEPSGGAGSSSMGKPTISRTDLKTSNSVLVAVGDIGMSNLLCWIAQDTTTSPYGANSQQRKVLEDALVEFMFEKQTKMPAWVGLLLAFLGAYGFQAGQAIQKRRNKTVTKTVTKPAGSSNTGLVNSSPINQFRPQPQTQQKTNPVPPQTTSQSNSQPIVNNTPPVSTQVALIDKTLIPNDKGEVHFPNPKYSFKNPDPDIIANDRNHLYDYMDKGIFPMYVRNKTNPNAIKQVPYDPITGEVKLGGRPAKLSR